MECDICLGEWDSNVKIPRSTFINEDYFIVDTHFVRFV